MDGDAGAEGDMDHNRSDQPLNGVNGDMGDHMDTDAAPMLNTSLNTSGFSMYDMNQMRIQNKQLKLDLQAEQDTVAQLRKRLNAAEKQKLDQTSQSNKEIGSLENQLAKVRAQIEKGEAVRHNLEFDLTRTQREVAQHKQQLTQRESNLQEAADELRQKISDLSDQAKKVELQLNSTKESASQQEHRLRQELSDRDQVAARLQAELDVCRNEKERLNAVAQQQGTTIHDFGDKVHIFESEHKNQSDDLRRAMSEIKFFKEREERLKKDIEESVAKIKSLEETVEAERAAHLETKFNSEIVQLRVRDLEGGLEVEKSANAEANRAVERLTKQNRELEQMYDEERKVKKEVMKKMDRTDKDYLSTRRQLGGEIEEKKTVIGSLSKELEVHQKNFNELKTELGKAKKRQAYLEESYGTAFKELEFLVMNYDTDEKAKRSKLASRKGEDMLKKPQGPSAMAETLKQMLVTYRHKLDTVTEESTRNRKMCEKQSKELDSCRDMIKSKDKALEEAHKSYTRTAKDLNKARGSYGELESMVGTLRSSLEVTSSSQGKDRTRIQELSEEIMKLVKRQKHENEEKLAFLHGLYQRLLAGRVLMSSLSKHKQEKPFNQLSWGELTDMVYEQVANTVDSLKRSQEKLKGLTDNLKSRDEVVAELQKQHEEQLSRLTQLSKDREAAWSRQKDEMEQHYAQLLADLQSRTKKSQAMADQAWEKMRATGGVQQGLESECSALRTQAAEAQGRVHTLLAACALLSGALYPLYARHNALSGQRHLLEEQMIIWDNCRERAHYLVNVLNSELAQSPNTPERDHRPGQQRNRLLQFRVGVIAVLAAHRLVRLGRHCARCFVAYDSVSAGNGLLVCTGGLKLQPPYSAVVDGDQSGADDSELTLPPSPGGRPQGQSGLLGWLTSAALADTVSSCMADVTDAALRIKDQGAPVEHRALVAAARSSFSKLMEHLGQFFPSVPLQTVLPSGHRRSLATRLGRTLARRLQGKTIAEKDCLVSSQDLLIALQNHILDFTQRLHTVEVERRQLLAELGGLKTQVAGLGSAFGGKLPSGDEAVQLVTLDKFERVCGELNEALKREQTAQHILTQQSRQLQELTARLDLSDTQGVHKQQTLAEAMSGLGELKENLRRKDQELKQSRKQGLQFEFQRKSLHANLRDAEDALRTAAKDKEILAQYIRSVEAALEEAKRSLVFPRDAAGSGGGSEVSVTLSKLLLNADLIPSDIGKAGPELIACQNLVGAFVDVHHQSMARVRTLEEETASMRQHVGSLKRELSDAVNRQYNEQDLPTRDEYDLTPSLSQTDISGKEEFLPLREDSEMSMSQPSLPASPEKSPNKSNLKSLRSPGLQTPKLSTHKSRSRMPVAGHR